MLLKRTFLHKPRKAGSFMNTRPFGTVITEPENCAGPVIGYVITS